MFGIALLPLAIGVGAAIEYGRMSSARANLDAAADAAAIAAVTQAANGREADVATRVFNANRRQAGDIRITSLNVAISGAKEALVTYQATIDSPFGGLIGRSRLELGGRARAAAGGEAFTDFYLMLDASGSMQIPATAAGRDGMRAAAGGCDVACHTGTTTAGQNSLAYARAQNYTLRYDQMLAGARAFLDLVRDDDAPPARNNRLQMLTFSETLDVRSTMNSRFSVTKAMLASTTQTDAWLGSGTHFNVVLPAVRSLMGSQGTGASLASPAKTLVIVTDAAHGVPFGPNTANEFHPMDASLCQPIKAQGIKIALIRLAYLPLPGDYIYDGVIAPQMPQYIQAARDCASPGLYFEADSQAQIDAGFQAAFAGLRSTVRLTR